MQWYYLDYPLRSEPKNEPIFVKSFLLPLSRASQIRHFFNSDSTVISPFALERISERSGSMRSQRYQNEARIPKNSIFRLEICYANEIFSQRTFLTATTQRLVDLARFDKLSLMVPVSQAGTLSISREKQFSLLRNFQLSLTLSCSLLPLRGLLYSQTSQIGEVQTGKALSSSLFGTAPYSSRSL